MMISVLVSPVAGRARSYPFDHPRGEISSVPPASGAGRLRRCRARPRVPGQGVLSSNPSATPGRLRPCVATAVGIVGSVGSGRTLWLADGRALGFDDVGDPDGTPALYVHGSPDSRRRGARHDRSPCVRHVVAGRAARRHRPPRRRCGPPHRHDPLDPDPRHPPVDLTGRVTPLLRPRGPSPG